MSEKDKVNNLRRKIPFVSGRTFREGSVGLLLLLGLAILGGAVLWLSRFAVFGKTYKVIVEFRNAGGMQKGAVVRYRGVKVGRIHSIQPGPNTVEVEIEISQSELIIPKNIVVEANQSGLIGESVIDITPKKRFVPNLKVAGPLDPNCEHTLIVCNGSRLQGRIGISMDELIRTTSRLAKVYTDPSFYANIDNTLNNTSIAASQIAELSGELTKLTRIAKRQFGSFSSAANSISKAADKISQSSSEAVIKLGNTAHEFGATAKNINLTVSQANKVLKNLDNLSPTLNRLNQGQLIRNLETLSANAAQASASLQYITTALSSPDNLLVLQKTLDSARVTFENTQKITSDLDALTGSPDFRQNLKKLIDGLSDLVSSTKKIERGIKFATNLEEVENSASSFIGIVKNNDVNHPRNNLKIPHTVLINTTKSTITDWE